MQSVDLAGTGWSGTAPAPATRNSLADAHLTEATHGKAPVAAWRLPRNQRPLGNKSFRSINRRPQGWALLVPGAGTPAVLLSQEPFLHRELRPDSTVRLPDHPCRNQPSLLSKMTRAWLRRTPSAQGSKAKRERTTSASVESLQRLPTAPPRHNAATRSSWKHKDSFFFLLGPTQV
jgi:hypothetical protein